MPIAPQSALTFGCGHVGVIDLSTLAADRRAARIAYFSDKGLCGSCFDATRDKRREPDRRNWMSARRKDDAAEATQWALRERYSPLTGNAKQVASAARVRFHMMHVLDQWAVQDANDPGGFERVEPIAKAIDTARWWLDHKSRLIGPRDLMQLLLQAAADEHAAEPCENTV